MLEPFETGRSDLVRADRVRIAGYRFGRDRQGELDVWVESGGKGRQFLSQLRVAGETYAVRQEVYAQVCHILREKATGRYWFLDLNNCGYWLHDDTFFGAATFAGGEALKTRKWLADACQEGALAPAGDYEGDMMRANGK